MNWKIIPFIVILFLGVPAVSQNLIEDDLDKLCTSFKPEVNKIRNSYPIDFKNEFSLIFSVSYHFYKSFISSQDANNCAFHPSCSTYAVETIKTNGILGLFDAFDRLTRCNGFSSAKYEKHPESQHLHDPVKKIH